MLYLRFGFLDQIYQSLIGPFQLIVFIKMLFGIVCGRELRIQRDGNLLSGIVVEALEGCLSSF